jgi:ABC-type transport system involved in cytochrome bd biosynthesis fused ATPase/permease subunit
MFALSKRATPRLLLAWGLGVSLWVCACAFAALSTAMAFGLDLSFLGSLEEYVPAVLAGQGALAAALGVSYHRVKETYVAEALSQMRAAVLVAVTSPGSPWAEERGQGLVVTEVSHSIEVQRLIFESVPVALVTVTCSAALMLVSVPAALCALFGIVGLTAAVATVSGRLTLGLETKALALEKSLQAQSRDSILRAREFAQYESGATRNARLVADAGIYTRTLSKAQGISNACLSLGVAALALLWAILVLVCGPASLPAVGGGAGVYVLGGALAVLFSISYRPAVVKGYALALGAAEILSTILSQSPVEEDALAGVAPVFGGAELRGVFCSDMEGEVLSDVSLVVEPGRLVYVQSENDRERAMLTGLFLRHVEADRGIVVLSGARVDSMSEEALRHTVAPVMRKTTLFPGSIRQNLRIGRPGASDEDIFEACRLAGLEDLLKFDEGLGSEVDDPAVAGAFTPDTLQRLGLARAILSEAPFIVMDDPTGDLGPIEEARFLRLVQRLGGDRTILLVARGDVATKIADASYQLDNGRIH